MKIQLDIPADMNRDLKVIKAANRFKSLKETILVILKTQLEQGRDDSTKSPTAQSNSQEEGKIQ